MTLEAGWRCLASDRLARNLAWGCSRHGGGSTFPARDRAWHFLIHNVSPLTFLTMSQVEQENIRNAQRVFSMATVTFRAVMHCKKRAVRFFCVEVHNGTTTRPDESTCSSWTEKLQRIDGAQSSYLQADAAPLARRIGIQQCRTSIETFVTPAPTAAIPSHREATRNAKEAHQAKGIHTTAREQVEFYSYSLYVGLAGSLVKEGSPHAATDSFLSATGAPLRPDSLQDWLRAGRCLLLSREPRRRHAHVVRVEAGPRVAEAAHLHKVENVVRSPKGDRVPDACRSTKRRR